MDTTTLNDDKLVTFDSLVAPLLERAQQLIGTTVAVDLPRSCKNTYLTSTTRKVRISEYV